MIVHYHITSSFYWGRGVKILLLLCYGIKVVVKTQKLKIMEYIYTIGIARKVWLFAENEQEFCFASFKVNS